MNRKLANICVMPGNPSFYGEGFQDYSPENLKKLKEHGADTIFINLAWSRPWIDAVVLEHTAISESYPLLSDEKEVLMRRDSLSKRAKNVKEEGMKAFALFGMPTYRDFSLLPEEYRVLMGQTVSSMAAASVTCVSSEETRKVYRELILDFLKNVPGCDGFLIYTYDELAEVCDESSDCPRCKGISNESRIAEFLNFVEECAKSVKADFEIWWEPWEVSWSQVYGVMEKLNKSIAVSCHSTINEVYFVNNPDLWIRSMASLAKEQGRKLIAEMFISGSGEDLGPVCGYPCPRLIYNQLDAFTRLDGICGIKEYFGWVTQYMSVNEKVVKAFLTGAKFVSFDGMISNIAQNYVCEENDELKLLRFWEFGSRILELIPWELSWVMRFSNYHPYDISYWGEISFKDLMKTPWNTPSWLSNRRSYYMIVDDTHNFTNDTAVDVRKRLEKVIELIENALGILTGVEFRAGKADKEIKMQCEAMIMLKYLIICRLNHLKLSILVEHVREAENPSTYDQELIEILNDEKENAKNLLNLLNSTDKPYLLEREKISQGIDKIDSYMKIAKKGSEGFINEYKFIKTVL